METRSKWMIYGAYGYSGRLITAEAVARGHQPLLAGRREEPLAELAKEHGLDHVAFDLSYVPALRDVLREVDVVLHVAGPFVHTAEPMMEACLATSTSYADITGEIPVFEMAFSRDERARASGVVLMPGVGFDVVPTDCMARYVADQTDRPHTLEIAFQAIGQASRGTTKSVVESLPSGNWVRRDGVLKPWPYGKGAREVELLCGRRWVMPIPWGDLVTAWHTTGIGNITTYMGMSPKQIRMLRLGGGVIRQLMKVGPLRSAALRWVDRNVKGPDEAERERGRSYVWARATGDSGSTEAWLETVEGYVFTARSSVRAVERLLSEEAAGAKTPAGLFGADFVTGIEGTRRVDSRSE